MTKKEKVQIVENAISEYFAAKRNGDADVIKAAINGMENVYIMMCDYCVPGVETLRKLILGGAVI